MKRLLWCLCLCSLCPIFITACGDDEGGGGSEDGGVTPADLDEVNAQLDSLNDSVDGLNDDVTGLGDQLDGLNGDLGDLTEEVNDRLDALENPDVLSCSVEEVCIPDGVELTTTGLAEIVEIVCEHEVDCCSDAELNLKFGPGITTAEQCVELFTDVVNNGLSPDFLQESPYIINQVIAIAQALNDPDVRVELNAEGIEACVESLQERECPEYTEPEPTDPVCVENELYDTDVCALQNLLTGMQEEGELCGAYGGGYYYDSIPECGPGLYCSWDGAWEGSERGICAKLPEEGDGCLNDYDCDPAAGEGGYWGSTLLYCNIEEAECAKMGDVGDACAFINEDFSIPDNNIYPTNRSATSQDCMPHLRCSPVSNECVANCNEGYLCSSEGDPFFQCGEGRVCNVTEFPDLDDNFGLGVCTDALQEGDTCTLGANECESEACTEDCDLDTGLCTCGAPLLQPGDECDTPGPDPLCVTGLCGSDSTCVGFCDCDESQGYDCDWVSDELGRDAEQCGDDQYCDFGATIQHPDLGTGYPCQPLIDNGDACDTTGSTTHAGCNSGFCDTDPGDDDMAPFNVCAAKVAAGAACTTGADEECPNTQYCNNNNVCATYLPENGNCDLTAPSGLRCAEGLACVDGAAADSCEQYAESGEACNGGGMPLPPCNPESNLSCIDIDGAGAGTVYECYDYNGGIADGVACQDVDSYCASGWCLPNAPAAATEWVCAQPLEEGDDCDTANVTLDKCAPGLFCNHPAGETEGKCAAQNLPGESCKPYFNGVDCVNGYFGSCVFTKDQFLCNTQAQPVETLFCDGN